MNSKPTVLVSISRRVARSLIEPVLWGIEEEGVPYELLDARNEVAAKLAKEAADGSALNVGIAIGESGEIVLHHRDLPAGRPLFALAADSLGIDELRRLGTNAGRLVKGLPLVLDAERARRMPSSPGAGVLDALDELVCRVLREILEECAKGKC